MTNDDKPKVCPITFVQIITLLYNKTMRRVKGTNDYLPLVIDIIRDVFIYTEVFQKKVLIFFGKKGYSQKAGTHLCYSQGVFFWV